MKLVTGVALAAGLLTSVGLAHADPSDVFSLDPGSSQNADGSRQNAGYLNMIRNANGITAGQDDTLIAYAHEWCAGGETPSGVTLIFQQGFPYGGIYIIRVAASKYFCPEHVATHPPGEGGPTMSPYPYGM